MSDIASTQEDLPVRDVIDTSLISGVVSVSTTAIEAKASTTRLPARKGMLICPTNGVVYLGTSSGVTTSTGVPIFKNEKYSLAVSDANPVYLIAATGTVSVVVWEGN